MESEILTVECKYDCVTFMISKRNRRRLRNAVARVDAEIQMFRQAPGSFTLEEREGDSDLFVEVKTLSLVRAELLVLRFKTLEDRTVELLQSKHARRCAGFPRVRIEPSACRAGRVDTVPLHEISVGFGAARPRGFRRGVFPEVGL